MLEFLFWLGPAVVVYEYGLFPLLMSLVARREVRSAEPAPVPVTVVIPAYNEERHVEARIRNLLALDYPRALLDVIVVSDASTDGTDTIARGFAADGVRLLVNETRRGKTAGLNRAVQVARGDVVVFTDANSVYPPDTLRRLLARFADARTGLVTGFTRYVVKETGEVVEAINAYTAIERVIKRAESRWGCCVGADGAIFAMRKSLYRTLRDDDINDLVLPLTVIDQGYGCVLAEDAFCSENPGHDLESEFQRQSRITNRSLRAIFRRSHLLNPVRFPAFAFFLWSHKVLRFLAPILLAVSALALVALAARADGWRLVLLATIAAAVALAVLGRLAARSASSWLRPVRLAHVFATINVAMLHGWWKYLTGRTDVTWQHDRMAATR